MTVLQFISSGGLFGAENVVLQLAEGLRVEGQFRPVVVVVANTHRPHLELAEACAKRDLEVVTVRCRGQLDPGLVVGLRRVVRSRGVDLIHSHGYKSNLYARLATVGLPVARVATCHNWLGESWKMRAYAALDLRVLRGFQRVVAVSEPVRDTLLSSGVKPGRVSIVRNGVDVGANGASRSRDAVRHALGIEPDAIVVGTVGRLSPEKGQRYLLEAVAQLRARNPRVRALVVGSGALLEPLRAEFPEPLAVFTGVRQDVADLYGAMDVFALPSLTEGLPMALLEAMAAGLPAVATPVGQVPQVLAGGAGILVAPESATELSEALASLLDHWDEQARPLGERARTRVRAEYSRQAMVSRYMDIYQEALQERGRR